MAVSITWSTTNGGTGITELDKGNAGAGGATALKTLHVRHDGKNKITNCKLYMASKSSSYSGDATAIDDYDELIAWGDGSSKNSFGGLQINMDAAGSFPAASYGEFNNKDPSKGFTIRTGVGDAKASAITLPSSTGAGSDASVPTGDTPNVRFQIRIKVPTDETTTGKREVDLRFRYSYTS